jgi:hypothetical protein
MFKIAIAALLSASVVGLAAPAQAVIYNYTISGIGSGTLDGAAFDNTAFTFTLVGDTTNLQSFGIEKVIDPLNAATCSTFIWPARLISTATSDRSTAMAYLPSSSSRV